MPPITCQAVGCCNARSPSQFMCKRHWFALPRALRTQVNATWRAWKAAEGEDRSLRWIDYNEARDEATRWTAEGEGKLADFEPYAPRLRKLQALRAET